MFGGHRLLFLTVLHICITLRWPEPIYTRVGYVFVWRFSAGMI